ncbi:hypothetical protein CLOM_g23271 [Closterium sp. NIES-68]|nr:hypothetical protein CLOM_g23271 [Closterium sp. NIES-68]
MSEEEMLMEEELYLRRQIAVGEEKMPEEGEARERWIEKSAVLFDLILQSVNKEMFEHIKDLVEADDSGRRDGHLQACSRQMVNAHKVALCKAQVHKVKVHKVIPILGCFSWLRMCMGMRVMWDL